MTGPLLEGRRDGAAFARPHVRAERLYVVRVRDRVDERIVGHPGGAYASPPQSHDSALTLVALLLGGGERPASDAGAWTRAIPGGQRTITLAPAAGGD